MRKNIQKSPDSFQSIGKEWETPVLKCKDLYNRYN